MSKPIDDGGSAFPMPSCPQCGVMHEPHHKDSFGMTLRDYFAAKAMTSMGYTLTYFAADPSTLTKVAQSAYATADAMIAERNRVPS